MAINNTTPPTQQSSGAFSKCNNAQFAAKKGGYTMMIDTNPNRAYTAIVNVSNTPVTLVLGDVTGSAYGSGIILAPYGGSFEIDQNNLYTGKIGVITLADCNLSYVECSN